MSVPSKIGRYEIVRRLGKSMTDVYLATDTVENRPVALKLVQDEGDAISRMVLDAERRGAEILKELRALDPRVIEVYDFGDLEGYFYVAMQYVEGRTVAETLESEGAIEPVRAAAIALEVCEQLAKLHSWRSTVVHADIKPSNIHLGPNDTVRLLDFGIAKTLRAGSDATVHNFGSPGYCPPERLSRSQVDEQSDLWAVGATLYEMLAGAPPYQAEDTRRLEALIRSRRPPRALPARCPRALREIVVKSLDPNAAERYRSAREFQEDLQAFLEHRPTLAEMERRPNRTVEAARACIRRATRTVAKAARGGAGWLRLWPNAPGRLRVAGAAAWFAAGMALWIGGSLAWDGVGAHRSGPAAERARAATRSPALPAEPPLAPAYVAVADAVFAAYRDNADPALQDFDWQKAEACLERAADLGSRDNQTLGRLALARGYAALERLNGGEYSEIAAPRIRSYVREQFTAAARDMPQSPDPRLALARLHVYSMPDVELAMAEFAAAQQLGATLGHREIEQQGDAYRLRALRELTSDPAQARRDIQTARAYYQRIPSFDRVDEYLRELNRMHPDSSKTKLRRPKRWR